MYRCGVDERAAGHLHRALAHRLVFASCVRSSVPEHSTSLKGSAFSYRLCEAMLCGVQRSVSSGASTTKWSLAQPREHAIGRLAVDHRGRAAFEDLRRVPRESLREAAHQRHRREDRGVARAAGDHDVGAGFERAMNGSAPIMPTMCALRSITASSNCGAGWSGLMRPSRSALLEIVLVLLGVDQRELECQVLRRAAISLTMPATRASWMSPPAVPAEPISSGTPSRRAPLQHEPQVALDGVVRKRGASRRRDRLGSGIGRSRVAADEVRLLTRALFERGSRRSPNRTRRWRTGCGPRRYRRGSFLPDHIVAFAAAVLGFELLFVEEFIFELRDLVVAEELGDGLPCRPAGRAGRRARRSPCTAS